MPRRNGPFRFLCSAPVIGVATGSLTLALPAEFVRRSYDVVPLAVASRLDQVTARLSISSGRTLLVIGGFAIGYAGRKYLSWLRRRSIAALLQYQGWVHGQTWKVKAWSVLLGCLQGSGPFTTFEFQQCLPQQPLPDLHATLERWLEASSAFMDESQCLNTRNAVEQFRLDEGPKLQAYLKNRSRSKDNWLTDYWLYAAYLSNRDSLLFNSNYYTTSVVPTSTTTDQLARTAVVIHQMTRFEQKVRRGELEPVMLNERVPLCMEGYKCLFNSARIPGEYVDTLLKSENHNYAIVIRNGLYFKLELYAPDKRGTSTILTPEEFKIQLQRICKQADGTPEDLPVAALTAQDRTTWAKHREMLSGANKKTLDAVEKSMFIISLDSSSPQTADEFANIVMTGRGNDRWFDKCYNTVTFANAYLGSSIEHTVLDAMIFGSFTEIIMSEERYENGDVIRDVKTPPRPMTSPIRLLWNLEGMEEAINDAFKLFRSQVQDIDLHILNCNYGKGFMKKCRISPDGYMQMALQLAYYRLHKEIPKTYEPATHRLYHLGRTETVHPGSRYSVAWIKSMDDPKSDVNDRKTLLRNAVKHQTQYRLEATIGKGCDRHLLGLLCASAELGMSRPKIFLDEAWSSPFKLSTSQTPNRIYETVGKNSLQYSLCNGGFGPTSNNGYGISYIIYGDDIINISIASRRSCLATSSTKLGETIANALEDMKKLLTTA